MRTLITSDSHLVPPPTLADELPERWRDLVTHVEHRADGSYVVPQKPRQAEAMMSSDTAAHRFDGDDELARVAHIPYREPARPAFDPQGRLAEMRSHGVAAAVL